MGKINTDEIPEDVRENMLALWEIISKYPLPEAKPKRRHTKTGDVSDPLKK